MAFQIKKNSASYKEVKSLQCNFNQIVSFSNIFKVTRKVLNANQFLSKVFTSSHSTIQIIKTLKQVLQIKFP